MALTKGQITKIALQELERRNADAWIQNNARTRAGYTFKGRLGVPDIIGFHKYTGVFIGCEVKTINDKISPFQVVLLRSLKKAGGIALIATEEKRTGNVVLVDIDLYLE